jgi:hypothetical protein
VGFSNVRRATAKVVGWARPSHAADAGLTAPLPGLNRDDVAVAHADEMLGGGVSVKRVLLLNSRCVLRKLFGPFESKRERAAG